MYRSSSSLPAARAASTTPQAPRPSPATMRASKRSAQGARLAPAHRTGGVVAAAEHLDGTLLDAPPAAGFVRREQAEADVPVRRHVVHPECRRRLVQGDLGLVHGHTPTGSTGPSAPECRNGQRRGTRRRDGGSRPRQPDFARQRSRARRLRSTRWAGTRLSMAGAPSADGAALMAPAADGSGATEAISSSSVGGTTPGR